VSLLGTAGWTVCFCGRICTACVDLLNRVFSTYLIGFRLRATKQERKSTLKSLRYYVFQDDQGSVFCKWAEKRCSRWRHSSTLGWCPRVTEIGTKIIIHGLVKQTQFYVSFITPWLRNGTFQRPQSFQFSNRSLFRSSPVVKDLKWRLKEYCQKNKRQRWDICEKFSVWRFVTKILGVTLGVTLRGRDGIFAKNSRCDASPRAAAPATLPKGNAGTKTNELMSMQAHIESFYLWNCHQFLCQKWMSYSNKSAYLDGNLRSCEKY